MSDLPLNQNEKILADWRPRIGLYLGKIGFIGVITALLFDAVHSYFGLPYAALTIPLGVVVYIVMFDDAQEWFARRRDHWVLTSHRLILSAPFEPQSPLSTDLTDITRISRWMWWALVLHLNNGQSATMSFLGTPNTVRDQILKARTARLEHAI